MMKTEPTAKTEGWRLPVHRENVPDDGLHLEREADAQVRERVSRLAGDVARVLALALSADITLHGEGLRVAGRVTAKVAQTCVVTLEPIENTVAESFDVLFLPPERGTGEDTASSASGPADVDETRESLVNDTADVGAVATEFFLLGIDRYPRKPDAVFAPAVEDSAADSPFAALAKLKPGKS
jgi:uncharacterized metal-binding protein YceD (DUF177 family)